MSLLSLPGFHQTSSCIMLGKAPPNGHHGYATRTWYVHKPFPGSAVGWRLEAVERSRSNRTTNRCCCIVHCIHLRRMASWRPCHCAGTFSQAPDHSSTLRLQVLVSYVQLFSITSIQLTFYQARLALCSSWYTIFRYTSNQYTESRLRKVELITYLSFLVHVSDFRCLN